MTSLELSNWPHGQMIPGRKENIKRFQQEISNAGSNGKARMFFVDPRLSKNRVSFEFIEDDIREWKEDAKLFPDIATVKRVLSTEVSLSILRCLWNQTIFESDLKLCLKLFLWLKKELDESSATKRRKVMSQIDFIFHIFSLSLEKVYSLKIGYKSIYTGLGKGDIHFDQTETSLRLLMEQWNMKNLVQKSVKSAQALVALSVLTLIERKDHIEGRLDVVKALETLESSSVWSQFYVSHPEKLRRDFIFFLNNVFEMEYIQHANFLIRQKQKKPDSIIAGNHLVTSSTEESVIVLPETTETNKIFIFSSSLQFWSNKLFREEFVKKEKVLLQTVEHFTSTKELRKETFLNEQISDNYKFTLDNSQDKAAAIAATGFSHIMLSEYKPKYVPKFCSEEVFFRNFFSRVYGVLELLFHSVTAVTNAVKLPKNITLTSKVLPPIRLLVGSTNRIKVKAVQSAVEKICIHKKIYGTLDSIEIEGKKVPSGVSLQPIGDEETRRGALNRCKALSQCVSPDDNNYRTILVGIEGGIKETNEGYECFAFVCIGGGLGAGRSEYIVTRSASFPVPPKVCRRLEAGLELGPAVDEVYGTIGVGKHDGLVGILTDNLIDRSEFYVQPCVLGLYSEIK
eukprot:maker-scaffold_7-snap-gene-8.61-mRNA-1 protein AED:0.25 eAED:0.25 QI:25/1/1/1/1/1/3/16/625